MFCDLLIDGESYVLTDLWWVVDVGDAGDDGDGVDDGGGGGDDEALC